MHATQRVLVVDVIWTLRSPNKGLHAISLRAGFQHGKQGRGVAPSSVLVDLYHILAIFFNFIFFIFYSLRGTRYRSISLFLRCKRIKDIAWRELTYARCQYIGLVFKDVMA